MERDEALVQPGPQYTVIKDLFNDLCTNKGSKEGRACVHKPQNEDILHAVCRQVPFLIFSQLLSHIEKLRTSMIDDLNKSNVFYKKRIEELGQRLQEQNELIITQRQQVCLGVYWHCASLSTTVCLRTCVFILDHF